MLRHIVPSRWLYLGIPLMLTVGCSTLFHDHSGDNVSAKDLPPLKLPEGQIVRPVQPMYPIPPGAVSDYDPTRKLVVPEPKPLAPLAAAVPASTSAQPVSVPKPVLTQDGNGYPILSIEGDFNPIWDRLGEALKKANVKVDDRDQSIGLYYLTLTDSEHKSRTAYQLRVTRGQSAYTLTLQKDDDTLAPQATTKTLFESIGSAWPTESGDMNGKARPPVHR
jgi:uncharacterized lipoprotein